jgi:hypothetical protein
MPDIRNDLQERALHRAYQGIAGPVEMGLEQLKRDP